MDSETWSPPDPLKYRNGEFTLDQFRTNSPEMRRTLEIVQTVAPTREPILLEGESGSGKELLAQIIHSLHPETRKGPFAGVNMKSISGTLFLTELCGHVKGTFTDARRDKRGRIALARGGTLLLDEMSYCPRDNQADLLRMLSEGKYAPLGGLPLPIGCRILIATSRDLEAMALREGSFLPELWWRICKVRIPLPPLRARRLDIVPSFRGMHVAKCAEYGRAREELSSEMASLLEAYSWPGNFRELEAFASEAALKGMGPAAEELARRHAEMGDLPPAARGEFLVEKATEVLAYHTAGLYRRFKGNVCRVGEALGRRLTAVYRYLRIAREHGWLPKRGW